MCDSNGIDVSVVIVSYNRLDVLRRTLVDLLHYFDEPIIEIILVDNASQEPIVEIIRKEFPQVQVIANNKNIGFGGGNNVGARQARGKFLLFANSDLALQGNPLPAMLKLFQANPLAGIVGCQLLNTDGSLQPSYFRFPCLTMRFIQLSGLKTLVNKLFPRLRFKYNSTFKLDFVSGAFFIIPSTLFFEIGGFDERYFMYIEDADLGFQVKRKGMESLLLNTRDVIHIGQHYEVIGHPFVYYQMNIGLLKFYAKNYNRWKYIAFVMISIVIFSWKLLLSLLKRNASMEQKQMREILYLYTSVLVHNKFKQKIIPQ
jgi:GT2 family glycosyltransferase